MYSGLVPICITDTCLKMVQNQLEHNSLRDVWSCISIALYKVCLLAVCYCTACAPMRDDSIASVSGDQQYK